MNEREKILKTLESSALLNGGQLQPEQQSTFIEEVRDNSKIFKLVRFAKKTQTKGEIDRIHIGEPITSKASENVPTDRKSRPKFGKIEYSTQKVRSAWDITHETLIENIERGKLEDTVMRMMSQRISVDLETLGIRGDAVANANEDTPMGHLLRVDDGWDKLTNSGHIVDCGGASVQKGIFAEMIRQLPEQYLNDPGLRWMVSRSVATDWMDINAERGTALGDASMEGRAVSPYGIPMEIIPLIPSTKPLTVRTGTHAQVISNEFDLYEISAGVNDMLLINVDANVAGPFPVFIRPGSYRAVEIAAIINNTPGLAGIAKDDGYGRVILTSPTTGVGSSIDIVDAPANAEIGFVESTTTGADTGTVGSVNEGSFIWLTNPKNLIVVMLNQTRVYSEYNKDYDRLEVVTYNEIDYLVENNDAVVKGINVRKRDIV